MEDYKTLFQEALICKQNNNPDEAEELYLKVLELEPDLTEAYYNLATIYYDRNDCQKAVDCGRSLSCKESLQYIPAMPPSINNKPVQMPQANGLRERRGALWCSTRAQTRCWACRAGSKSKADTFSKNSFSVLIAAPYSGVFFVRRGIAMFPHWFRLSGLRRQFRGWSVRKKT